MSGKVRFGISKTKRSIWMMTLFLVQFHRFGQIGSVKLVLESVKLVWDRLDLKHGWDSNDAKYSIFLQWYITLSKKRLLKSLICNGIGVLDQLDGIGPTWRNWESKKCVFNENGFFWTSINQLRWTFSNLSNVIVFSKFRRTHFR